ncbi:replication-relaxation family protein [Ornithinibacillus contaminans]|uniref:replication-relaxation family protein n=1 Tax=Ornithinibacillus contaminans TaxID=694055 RepID=UPI00064D909A|nr:replication-relaxation family protein [Ornithinibacillus contaminans]
MDKKSYYFAANGKGVQLERFELEMLAFLSQQKVLTIKQLYKYSCHYKDISYNSFRNKIWRWKKYSVVEVKTITLKRRWGNEVSILSIGQNGLRILVSEGYLPSTWINNDLKTNFTISNYDHYFTTQQVVLDTVLRIKSKGLPIASIRPSQLSNLIIDEYEAVIPDWILKCGENKLVFIESDMGTETLGILENKVKKYIELARSNPTNKFIVMFVLVDDSLETQKFYKNNGDKRLANMKKTFLNSNIIHQENFALFISHMNRAPLIIDKAMNNDDRASHQLAVTHKILNEINKHFEYTFIPITSSEVYLQDTQKFLYADKVVRMSNLAQSSSFNVLVEYVTEGDMQQLDRLYHLNQLIQKGLFKQKIDKIVAVYQNIEERENDNLAAVMGNVLVLDNETLLKNLDKDPIFFEIISPVKLNPIRLDGMSTLNWTKIIGAAV